MNNSEQKIIFNSNEASDTYIEDFSRLFIEKNANYINKLCFKIYGNNSKVSILALQEILFSEIKKACYSFVNNEHNSRYIEPYLFSCLKKTVKIIKSDGKRNSYVCPGCKHFSKLELLDMVSDKLVCNSCRNNFIHAQDGWEKQFYQTFAEHNRRGFKCPDCNQFIPDNGAQNITCPYPNCFFVGDIANIAVMRHPVIKANREMPFTACNFDKLQSSDTSISVEDEIKEYISILNNTIDLQVSSLRYKTNSSTLLNKACMYDAYKNMISKYPEEMISYLIFLNRGMKIQQKIFQEFVSILESKIPFEYIKNNKIYKVESLLSEDLCVFDGVSEFDAGVNEDCEVLNLTNELYVGGRKGVYCRPYYIGKLLDVIDIGSGKSILSDVKEYSFTKIIMNENVLPDTKVRVKHLRIPPHYQMGGMVYLNRIRRSLVDKVYLIMNGKKRETIYDKHAKMASNI